MEIKLHSYNTKDSLFLRNLLEGMYRKVGHVDWVDFPDQNTVKLLIEGEYEYENEFGVHRIIRTVNSFNPVRRVSHVMVEIDGRTRDDVVASYIFDPEPIAVNEKTGIERPLLDVLSGDPLEMEQKIFEPAYLSEFVR